jgi:DeoR/GlpR family transcriptional regulator of sugar metabolism
MARVCAHALNLTERCWRVLTVVGFAVLAGQRQMLIAERVRQRGAMRVSELTEMFGVSDMTIRRDLDVLAESGVIEKVHGGATAR